MEAVGKKLPFWGNSDRTIAGEMVRLAVPAIGQLLIQNLLFLVDRVMLGHYSITALASLQISQPLVSCTVEVLCFITVGLVALVGRSVGAENRSFAGAVIKVSLGYALIVGVAVSVIIWLNLDAVLSSFPSLEIAIQEAARNYLEISLIGLPLLMLISVAATVLQATGDTLTPFLLGIIANGVNVAVNYCLIFGHWGAPKLGVQGAAIGTVSALSIEMTFLLLVLVRNHNFFTWLGWGNELATFWRVLSISAPVFGERLVRQVGITVSIATLGILGEKAMSVFQVILCFENFIQAFADGLGIAAAVIVAQGLGAKKPEVAVLGSTSAIICMAGISVLCGLGLILFPSQLIGWFLPGESIDNTAIHSFYLAAVEQFFMAISVCLTRVLQSRGDTQIVTVVSLACWSVIRCSAIYLFVFVLDWGLVGLWLGLTCDWFVRTCALGCLFFQKRWQQFVV